MSASKKSYRSLRQRSKKYLYGNIFNMSWCNISVKTKLKKFHFHWLYHTPWEVKTLWTILYSLVASLNIPVNNWQFENIYHNIANAKFARNIVKSLLDEQWYYQWQQNSMRCPLIKTTGDTGTFFIWWICGQDTPPVFIDRKYSREVMDKILFHWCSIFGFMQGILHDNGGEFIGEEIRKISNVLNVEDNTTGAESLWENTFFGCKWKKIIQLHHLKLYWHGQVMHKICYR